MTQLSSGGLFSCVLLDNGAVQCWGRNNFGQLGYGNTNDIGDDEFPFGNVNIGGGTVEQIAVGGGHSCVLLTNKNVRCWGSGASGQLGHGNTQNIGDNEAPASAGDTPVL